MDRRSLAPSCGDLRQADETKAHHAGFVIGASISAYCPDQAPPRSVNVRTTASRPRRLCAPTECSLSSNEASTLAAAGRCHPLGVRWPGRGRRLVPTKLAHLSVKGHGLAIAALVSVHEVNAPGFVGASLVGSGTGDADTWIVGVCLCWWNAEGCQCYGCCR